MEYTYITTIQVIFAVACVFAAEKRGGYPLTWFILGLIFGPIAFIVAITSGKRCPHCLSFIAKDAKVCRNCGQTL
jgi:hypothetical protein